MSDDTFGESGVIPGAGTAGEKMADWGDSIMLDPTDGQVVMYYGISAWVITGLAMILYFSLNNYSWAMANLYWSFIIHEIAWAPTAIIWTALAFWDARWLRSVYESVITISFLGPFAGYWVGLGMFFVGVDASDCWGCW